MLTLILTCVLPIEAKTRRAVVIGLGEQLDKSWGKINGDKDVPLVVNMLKANGFNDIATLTNPKATKAGIVNAFNSLINRSQNGDIVYIQFSGHGQMMTDMNGDEKDGFDEAWIQIGSEGVIAVVVDACHSGDSTRDLCERDSVVVRGVDVNFVIPGKKSKSKGIHGS